MFPITTPWEIYRVPHFDWVGIAFLIRQELNFNWVETNSAMIHVRVLRTKVRRNEQLK